MTSMFRGGSALALLTCRSEVATMITNGIHEESERERRWCVFLCIVMTAVGFAITIYGAAFVAGLIVRWFVRPY